MKFEFTLSQLKEDGTTTILQKKKILVMSLNLILFLIRQKMKEKHSGILFRKQQEQIRNMLMIIQSIR